MKCAIGGSATSTRSGPRDGSLLLGDGHYHRAHAALTRSGPQRNGWAAPLLMLIAAALLYVARLVAPHTIAVVERRQLLPRWDLATHLVLGWTDYRFLVT